MPEDKNLFDKLVGGFVDGYVKPVTNSIKRAAQLTPTLPSSQIINGLDTVATGFRYIQKNGLKLGTGNMLTGHSGEADEKKQIPPYKPREIFKLKPQKPSAPVAETTKEAVSTKHSTSHKVRKQPKHAKHDAHAETKKDLPPAPPPKVAKPAVVAPKAVIPKATGMLEKIEAYYQAHKGDKGGPDWKKFAEAQDFKNLDDVKALQNAGESYEKTLHASRTATLTGNKPDFVRGGHLKGLGFAENVDLKDIALKDYAEPLAISNARKAAEKLLPAAGAATVNAPAGTDANFTTINLQSAWKDGELKTALEDIAPGTTIRFTQLSATNTLLTHNYLKDEKGKFTHLVGSEGKGDALTTDALIARTEDWGRLAQKLGIQKTPDLTAESVAKLQVKYVHQLEGLPDLNRNFNPQGRVAFFGAGASKPLDMDKRYLAQEGRMSAVALAQKAEADKTADFSGSILSAEGMASRPGAGATLG